MIIGLTGKKQHGKNAVCDVLADYGFTVVGFADTLKDLSYAVDPIIGFTQADGIVTPIGIKDAVDVEGWEVVKEKYPHARRFLQRMGTEGARKHLSDGIWIDVWNRKVAALHGAPAAASDLRFLNEAAAITAVGGIIWKVIRPSRVTITDGHASEMELEQIVADHTFINDGTLDDLRKNVEAQLRRVSHPAYTAPARSAQPVESALQLGAA